MALHSAGSALAGGCIGTNTAWQGQSLQAGAAARGVAQPLPMCIGLLAPHDSLLQWFQCSTQIEENMKALEVLPKLTPDVVAKIEEITSRPAPATA